MGQHRALGQAGRAARILQQGEILGRNGRKFGSARPGAEEIDPCHDAGPGRARPCQRRRAEGGVVADDDAVDQSFRQKFGRGERHLGDIGRDDGSRAAVGQLVSKHARAVERAQMHDGGAGLERAEEGVGMIERVGQQQRHTRAVAEAKRQERRGRAVNLAFQFGIGDLSVAKNEGDLVTPPLR